MGAAGVMGRGGGGNARSPNCICMPLTVAVSEETWLTRAPMAWMAWASCSSGVDIVIGEEIEDGLDDGVDRSENCGEVERSRKILNNSSWGRAHDPVQSLSFKKPVKKSPKNDLLIRAVG